MEKVKDITSKGSFTILAKNLEETHAIGIDIGLQLNKKTIITLKGDLGSGKTSFVQGLAQGLDVPKEYYITSPTYNIINEYPGKLRLYHIDLYRINGSDELFDIGFEEILDDNGVIAIEWPDRLPEGWLNPDIKIDIEILKDDSRKFFLQVV